MRLRYALVLAALAAQSLGAAGQQAQTPTPPATGAITGVVVDGATGAAIADVVVTLSGAPLPPEYPARQLSDARGRFAFMNLPNAETFLVATGERKAVDRAMGLFQSMTESYGANAVGHSGVSPP